MARHFFMIICVLGAKFGAAGAESYLNTSYFMVDDMNDYVTNKYGDCIVNIINNGISRKAVITLVVSGPDVDNIVTSISQNQRNSFVMRSRHKQPWYIKPDAYIFILEDVDVLAAMLTEYRIESAWNPAAKIILILRHVESDNLNLVFTILLKYKIYSVVMLIESTNDVDMYTYYPFNNQNCGRNFDDVIHLGGCKYAEDIKLFPDEESFTYRNCTLVVAVKHDIPYIIYKNEINYTCSHFQNILGMEERILNKISAIEGITLKYMYTPHDSLRGTVSPNGNITGLLHFLYNGTADIVASGYGLLKNRADLFDFVWGYDSTSFDITTSFEFPDRTAHQQFSEVTWFLLLCSYLLVALVTFVINELTLNKPQDHVSIMFKLLGYFVGQTDKYMFKNEKAKCILILWVWLTLFVGNLYTTSVRSAKTAPNPYPTPYYLSRQEHNEMFHEPCINTDTRLYLLIGYDRTFEENKRPDKCDTIEKSFNTVANTKGMYTISRIFDLYFVKKNNKIVLYRKPLNLGFTSTVMYTTKGFTMTKVFQKYISEFYANGYVQYYMGVVGPCITIRSQVINADSETPTEYYKYFKLLLCGYILSLLCFVVERLKKN